MEKTFKEHDLKYTEVISWSTDGFYRETKEKVLYRKEEGCSVVEMECFALAINKSRKIKFRLLLIIKHTSA